MFGEQIARRLAEALDKLSIRQRAVFVLRYYDDRSLNEIAAVLELDVGTVKAHLARAVAKLREQLRDLHEPRNRHSIKRIAAALTVIVLAIILVAPNPGPPLIAQRDARLLNDIYQIVGSPEPPATIPIHGLFEEK